MDDILNKIFEMDEAARNEIEEVKKQKLNSEAEIKSVKQKIYQKYIDSAQKKINESNAEQLRAAEKNLQEYQKKNEEILSDLALIYSNNKDKWVEDIYNNILKVE